MNRLDKIKQFLNPTDFDITDPGDILSSLLVLAGYMAIIAFSLAQLCKTIF